VNKDTVTGSESIELAVYGLPTFRVVTPSTKSQNDPVVLYALHKSNSGLERC